MLADVKSPHVDDLIGLVQHLRSRVLPFQIRLLFPAQTLRVPLKPQIDGFFVLRHLHVTPFIQKRNHRAVRNGLRDGVMGLHQFTELGKVVLLLL